MSDLHQDLSQRRARLSPEQRARLNELLRGADAAGSADADAAIAPRAAGEPAPLSFAQLRQWFLWKLEPESTAYHVGGGLKFVGALDVEALRAGVSAVVDRHEALRTVFEEDGEGGATQRVLPAAGFELQTLALHRLPEAERAARLAEERAAITGTPFDLTRGPLLRMSLLQTGEREWQLLVVMHHIVSDGWSVQVVLDELAALYRAQVQGTPQALPGLPLHYADYAAWQRRWLAAGEGERQLAWWKAQLGEDQPALALAADHPRRADGSYTAAHHLLSLPGALVDTLRGRAREEGATLFMLLLAAFQGLLHRYTGQEDVRVGVPIANRNRAETAGIVGFFVNTQVLRARIAPRTRLNALLTQVRDTALGAQAHQDLPFERLVEALQPERSLSTNPLFQVMFNHLRRDHRALAGWPGVEVERLDFDEQAAQFELTLQTCEYEDGRVDANFIYAAELFDAATVERMAGHYLALLRAFAEQHELSLDEVQLLGGAELAQLRTWGENPERFDDAQPIHRLIEARAAASPDAVAVIFGEAQLSYGELNQRANRLAHHLIGRGVGLEVKVGIAVERSLEMVVGLLAVLKAGGAYVPLDPAYPAERLGYMVEDSGIALLLTCSDVRDHVPAGPGVAILELDLLDFDGGCESPPEVAVCGGNLAYLIYTSGSTGRPKGVMVRHSSLSNFMCAMAGAPGVTAEDVLLALTSLSFDIAALELFLPLVQGASIVLATRDAVHDGGALARLAVDHGVTVLQATPSGWRALMQGNWPLAPGKPLKGLCGGEALHPDLACSLMEGGVELWNMYGPTETTIWSAARHTQGSPAIGGAIAATQLRVLDQGLNPVPIGVPGELYLGGAGLARGYLNRPGLSAERFIADPYDEAGGRLYRTGDLVRWNAEGELEYLGRIDHQVKIRGFRIELGEVEAQLLAQPEVREAVVVAAEGPGGARLVGYVALKPEARCESGQLRSRLAASLPEYMVPAALILLERLPLNANGKVDRKALPKPELAGTQAYEAPQGEVEQALAAIWAELLGTERIGRQDGFFELGGDSILSLKLVARLHRAGFRASPRQVFEHQRLESFARTLVAATEAGSGMEGSIPVLDPAARGEGLALSYAQRRQWFLWELDRASTAYHIAGGLRLQGEVNLDALQGSFAALVSRHESLRTVFLADEQGLARQHIQAQGKPAFELIDLSGTPAEESEARARAAAERLHSTPFDLSQGPLLRIGLIRLSAREHLLIVVMHHIISDGWSMQILVDEFVAHYRAAVEGRQAHLPPPTIQYADYAQWQRQWLEAGEKARQLDYWQTQLGTEHPLLHLPTDRPRRADGRYSAARWTVSVPERLTHTLRKLAQLENTTVFVTLLAGLQALLHRYTGQEDIRIGVPIANRHRIETESVIGFFVNTQVLRNRIGSRDRLADVLARSREAALGAQTHQDLPFEHLVEALQPERSLGTTPLFQVMFNHLKHDARALHSLPGLTLQAYELGAKAAQFELTVEALEQAGGGLKLSFIYARELFDPAKVARLASHYLALLEALAEAPGQALSDVPLLSAAEREQLKGWSENGAPPASAAPIHRLIEAQAAAHPDAVAVIFGEAQLSYGELNQRANQLAHHLTGRGVGPEVKVGIAVERSLEMVVGLLAILKAGGAYVPLDPEYPAERLGYMMEDSGIGLLLTQRALRAQLPLPGGLAVLELDTLALTAEPTHNPDVPLSGENLAYVIYTSGSTGRPKAVAVAHAPLAMHLQAVIGQFGLSPNDRLLQFASLSFDAAVSQWASPLLAGAATVILAAEDRETARLTAEARARGLTAFHLPPAYLRELAATQDESGLPVRLCIGGGEAWPAENYRTACKAFMPERLVNSYGPTEAVISPCVWEGRRDDILQSAYVPIGRPVGERKAYVLDTELNLTPAGVAGELYLGGVGLARGYLNRPGLSAERFIADPYDESGGRLYRTGDLVRWNAEGELEYLGRIDHQVKIRGFRIELGEVEAQLLAQPEVREAVVVADEGPGGARLVGYVSAQAGAEIDTAELRTKLGEQLPDYMVPSVLMVLDALPLNANGKIDRKALPKAEAGSTQAYEAPQGEVEERLAAIWAEVLGVERVGRQDSFFELGGHSLLALKLLERMRSQGLPTSVKRLFQHPQLAAFAAALESEPQPAEVVVPPNRIPADCNAIAPEMLTLVELDREEIGRIEAAVPGGAANIQDIYPLAPLQEGILFHHLLQQEGDAYVTTFELGCDSRERLEGFIASLNHAIGRHDILRTAVHWEGLREPVQVVHRQAEVRLQWLEAGEGEEARAQLEAHVAPGRYRIDVRQAPLIHALAIKDEAQQRWLLALPCHHLISDHTTLELLVGEIALIQEGRQAGLPEPVPFRRFVAQAKRGVSVAEHEAFFTRLLGDVDEPTAPFGLLDIQGDGSGIEEARLPLESALASALRAQARQHGVSAASLFHLAWALVLGKTTGRDDVVFGTVLFGRMQGGAQADKALGLFINTLPMRVRLGTDTVQASLSQTHQILTELLHHEHASLALAQRCSGLPGGTPLFSALLNYRHSPQRMGDGVPMLEGLQALSGEERTNYPVTMSVDDLGAGFELVAQAGPEAGAQRLCAYMHAAVSAVVAALQNTRAAPVCELTLLGERERAQLMTWGENRERYAGAQPIHRLIEAQAAARPDAVAVIFGEAQLSYGELNQRANQLAHHLTGRGVGPEVKVGIAVERSLEMVVGLLAILKAGGAYVPLDPEYPAERLGYMMEDSGIGLLLTQRALRAQLPLPGGLAVLELDTLALTAEPTHNPDVLLSGENLAYVIYTSGSTGRPKGAANRHHALYNRLKWMQDAYRLNAQDTVLQKTPFSFDVSVWEFFWPLMVGARLVVAAPGEHREPARLVERIVRHQVTTLHFVPSMLQAFLAHEGIEACTSLRRIVCSGEALPAEALQGVFARLPQAALYNLYGPTEAAIDVTHWTCRGDGRSLVPIGAPISGIRTHVLDGELNLTPAGVAGELYLGGVGLARGYLNRPGLSAERFIADPYDEAGGRLYRTGDLVRWNAEGELEYLGRIDHQVKIRGFRIELGEVEAQLLAQPQIREAVVVADEGPGGARLVGYVSAQAGAEIDTAELRTKLGEQLPDYMVPSVLMVLDSLPLNANGKIDRKALPKAEAGSTQAYEAPQGEVEERLAAIWAEVLGVERVGRQDSFFELGGHSLLALKLLERMRTQGLPASVKRLFQHPQLAAFAAALESEPQPAEVAVPPNRIPADCAAITPEMLTLVTLDREEIGRIEAAVPGGAANIQDIYPLAPLQEGMLFHHLAQQQGDAYVTQNLLAFDRRERLESFVSSLNQAIQRHDILRTTMLWEGLHEPVQVVHRQAEVRLQWLEAAEGEDARSLLEARVAPGRYRIDVRQAPLIHALAAHDLPQGRWLLCLPCHHLILDHSTLELLVGEIALIQQGREAELPEPVPFRRFVAQARLGVSAAEHERFFTRLLGDVAEPTAPFGLLDIQGDGSAIEAARLALEPSLALAIRSQARQYGVSAASLFHLAWALVLGKTTGRDDVVFGTVLFGRMQGGAQADKALGLFINTLPMRVRLGTDTVQASLSQTHQTLTELLHHEHASLALAQRCSGLPGGTPLFSALLNYRHSPQGEQAQGTAWEGLEVLSGEERTNYPLGVSVNDLGEGFQLVAQAVPEASAQRLCAYLHAAVSAVVAALQDASATPVCELALLGERERAQLMAWGENRERYAGAQPIHRLIEWQAVERPDAAAVILGEASLSYGELNRRANLLAHHLTGLGVGPEVKVGIAVERSLELVVGLLAILKAGGAYVPLDPEYPADRLGYMMEDSGIALLLTQSAVRAQLPVSTGLAVLALDTLALPREPEHKPGVAVSGENLAYVIYTSGSTGRPKGVAVTHGPLSMHCQETAILYEMGPASRELHFLSFSFDGAHERLLTALSCGAALVLRDASLWPAQQTLTALQQHRISNAGFPAAYLRQLAEQGAERGMPPPVRLYSFGGEAMPREGFENIRHTLKPELLINGYGPTEAVVTPLVWKVAGSRACSSAYAPIGKPVGDRKAYVLDTELNLTPAGVAGELYLGGVGLARGYLNRPGLSAERFIADPYDEAGGRLYRTGDLVRWNAEGELEYLGRIDHQVKIRGFRIELGEVEAQLLAQPEVREAVVVADEGPGGARLVGYVSAQVGAEIDTAELRTKLGEQLPDYMVPSVLMVLDALPLNANGKIDRKALPKAEAGSEQAYEAPQGEVEERLAAIWAEVLGVERVGRQDSFFELGGHSLLALKLLERMRTQGLPASVKRLFQHPQLAAFAAALESEPQPAEVVVPPNRIPADCTAITPEMLTLVELDQEEIGRIEATVPGGAANIQDIYPLAPLQEGILFHHLIQSEGDAYIARTLLGFDKRARLEGFIASLNQVIARHDILRTGVHWEGLREPVQVVHRHAEVRVHWLETGPGEDARVRLDEYVALGRYRIDVRKAPLIHAVAVQQPDRCLLALPCHHLISDHTTLELLVGEIALLQQGRKAELLEPVPFRRFVAQAKLGVSAAEHQAFFTRLLGDVVEPTAPFGLLDVRGDGSGVEETRLSLAAPLARAIREHARSRGVSAASLFHLAWAMALGVVAGRNDVVFGTVLFGRMQGGAQADKAMGLFINTLPMRIRLRAGSVLECLKQTHRTLSDLLHHEHASLALAQRCSGLPGGTPLFSALLNYRYGTSGKKDYGNAWQGLEALGGEERTNYPVTLSVDDLGEGFDLVVQVVRPTGTRRLGDYMLQALSAIVEALAGASERPLSEIPLLSAAEREQLQNWSQNGDRPASAAPIHRLIEVQAASHPDAVAVIFGEAQLSYGELNRQANQLAHHLTGLGVGPEVKVGIAVERSLDMVVGLLAILKAGGAYVPLDPEYPAERLGYMMEDSGIGLLLTQRALRAQLPLPSGLTVLELDTLALTAEPAHNPEVPVSGENLAYVIYTSGSTGRPKAVAVAHAPLAMHLQAVIGKFGLSTSDRLLQFASLSFDAAVSQWASPLVAGGAVVVLATEDRETARLTAAARARGLTAFHLPPAYLRELAATQDESGLPVRLCIAGGEAWPAENYRTACKAFMPERLVNSYGPTEAVISPCVWEGRRDDILQNAYVPIGRPVGDRKAHVLDTELNLTPAGVAGELYLGGVGLARGYLNRPGLSAERFIADPYDEAGGRLYRTGDLVRWNAEGELEYLGRIDHQVKIRGFRIELGEVEAQLLAQPQIREAVVVADEGPGGARLVGYVSAQAGEEIDTAGLRMKLGEQLPDYMVPSVVMVLDALPLNANGKIDRKALPKAEAGSSQDYEAPQGEVEERLAAIWAEVLGVERVGRQDSFFELGGHSLLAIQIVARVGDRLNQSLSLREVFLHPRLMDMASALNQGEEEQSVADMLASIDAFIDDLETA